MSGSRGWLKAGGCRRLWRRSVRLRHARGGLQCRAPARAISFAGAAWPLYPRDRHCCGSGALRRHAKGSLLTGFLLPTGLIAVSVFRLSSWFKARAGVELEALDRVRRKVRVASVLGPTLTFAFALAISAWQ